jgi:hypothetical protein
LLSSDGVTYELRGWNFESGFSNIAVNNESSIAVGFIGDFSYTYPPDNQIGELKAFIAEALRRKDLASDFKIYGYQSSSNDGQMLFRIIRKMERFNGFL